MTRHSYTRPGNDDEFEDFCVRFYSHLLKRGGLVRYAKRGEGQEGIDIIDQLGMKPFFVIQCKHREAHKNLRPSEIKKEVCKAESSNHPIDEYIIATTAKKSALAENTVLSLNQRSDGTRQFPVKIHFWEEICTYLDEFGEAVAEFIVYGKRAAKDQIALLILGSGYQLIPVESPSGVNATEKYSSVDALFKARKLEAAEYEISKLPDPLTETALSIDEQYAILRLRARLAMERLEFDEGARLFKLAYARRPDLEQARQNYVLALEFSGERKLAFEEAEKLIVDGVRSSFLISLLIRNSSATDDLSRHWEVVESYTNSEEDVNLALVDRYIAWGQIEEAETAARRALSISPQSAHAQFFCGMAAHNAAIKGGWQGRFVRLNEAIDYYTKALASAERGKHAGLPPEIYSNRGRARSAVNDFANAAIDFRDAVRVAASPSLYAESAVMFFLNTQDFQAARICASP